ncbi:Glycosyltransferase involved in cell wall bisynthesis [Micromonospora phaseoli]|uniref:Glycosyltransferase involved in cell wall bisynthesis n=1 Tax=Micromonospora phaseoli TaxID=1144548 RepID=A0A1H6SDK2_9ACTN|nr:glycosyltransferase family 4 protein [Micromonospora phaseoli]PZW03918.1 glycosyltransferase involved in cell wall biosynthesis [Micromonospora phaseoli]GIJ77668.1 glycosyltransferase WbuB [Micromonospora phaseoli]SEI66073.1 Glycosyltransferase involved in cell wall bisynthesis [Micromonospora phaseoli]
MRIGIVSQWFPPEPAFLTGGLATQLAARGHEVRVLTAFPNFPGGRIYPGYRQRWRAVENHAGCQVRRVPVYPSHDSSAVGRVLNYVSYATSSSLAAIRFLSGLDAIYVYHPPATAFTAAVLPRLLRRTPVLLHVQDIWPESVTASAMISDGLVGSLLDRVLSAAMRRVYQASDAIAVLSPSMAELVVERGADPGAVRVVFNWTEENLFRPVPVTPQARALLGHRGRCLVMFAGNMGPFQRIETAVRAAAAVPDRIDLVLAGSGVEEPRARRIAEDLGATNVRFLDRHPPEEMAALYAVADFQLVCLRDLPALRGTMPSKLQAALACARPVVAAAPGDVVRLVDAHRIGLSCPPEDWRALAETFAAAADLPESERAAMGARARQVYQERMSLSAGVDQIEDMLHKIAGRPRGSGR